MTSGVAAAPERRVLTPQELNVARLTAAGLTSKEMAAHAGVSVRTVGMQLQRAYDKLGVRRRSDLPEALALRGHRNWIIQP